jgi:hypothetical protein
MPAARVGATVAGMTASPMLIESLLPTLDAVRTEHLGDERGTGVPT